MIELNIPEGVKVFRIKSIRDSSDGSFERTKAALNADRGAGDSYTNCRNPDNGDIRKYSFIGITLADITPPYRK
ncbi:MAG: hypothetical protein WCI72_02020 [archaeon]